MKKISALILCFAMLFTVLSVNVFAAESTGNVSVVTNTTKNGSADFAVKLSGFQSLKGIDITVTGTGLKFGGTVTGSGLKNEFTKNKNYTVNGNVIKVVDLTASVTGEIIIKGTANLNEGVTAPKINVTACKLAKSDKELYNENSEYTFDDEKLLASEIIETTVTVPSDNSTITQTDAGEGYFIPYGSVSYKDDQGKLQYVNKTTAGNFDNVPVSAKVLKFPKPDNGITTFGISNSDVEEKPARQFGTYVNNYDSVNKKYGSLVLVGDWDAFVTAYQTKHENAYVSEILARLYDVYDANIPGNDFVTATVNDKGVKTSVRMYKVAQTNYMWKDDANNILEYAVRVYGLNNNETYTAVAYNSNTDGKSPVFSAAIKSDKYVA